MALFGNKTGGFTDEIRCDEPSYLIWKWHPSGRVSGSGGRENAVRWGSSLRVKDGEAAVFVYKQDDGTVQDFIEGPFDGILKTSNLPVIASIVGLAYEGGTPFQAEVYFINLANVIQTRFAVPFFDIYDPRFLDFGVPAAVRGTVSFKITDYRKFIKLHRLINFNLADFERQIRDAVIRYVKNVVSNAPEKYNIPVLQIERKTMQINEMIETDVKERLSNDFGVTVSGFDIGSIELDKDSDGYRQLMSVTKNITAETMQAQAEANIKNIYDKQRIEAENYEETLRIQRQEGQYARHMQTQTSNFGAFQVEKQAEVGVAGAEALGHMGSNGAGNVDLSGGGDGFNMAAMMASMAVGGAVGQNIAGAMNNIMSGANQPVQSGTVPPPIPIVSYYVAINNQAAGPFDISALTQMAADGSFTRDSFVWKQGMESWDKAGATEDLKNLFNTAPPAVPAE